MQNDNESPISAANLQRERNPSEGETSVPHLSAAFFETLKAMGPEPFMQACAYAAIRGDAHSMMAALSTLQPEQVYEPVLWDLEKRYTLKVCPHAQSHVGENFKPLDNKLFWVSNIHDLVLVLLDQNVHPWDLPLSKIDETRRFNPDHLSASQQAARQSLLQMSIEGTLAQANRRSPKSAESFTTNGHSTDFHGFQPWISLLESMCRNRRSDDEILGALQNTPEQVFIYGKHDLEKIVDPLTKLLHTKCLQWMSENNLIDKIYRSAGFDASRKTDYFIEVIETNIPRLQEENKEAVLRMVKETFQKCIDIEENEINKTNKRFYVLEKLIDFSDYENISGEFDELRKTIINDLDLYFQKTGDDAWDIDNPWKNFNPSLATLKTAVTHADSEIISKLRNMWKSDHEFMDPRHLGLEAKLKSRDLNHPIQSEIKKCLSLIDFIGIDINQKFKNVQNRYHDLIGYQKESMFHVLGSRIKGNDDALELLKQLAAHGFDPDVRDGRNTMRVYLEDGDRPAWNDFVGQFRAHQKARDVLQELLPDLQSRNPSRRP